MCKESLQNHQLSLNNYRNVILAKCEFHAIDNACIFEEASYLWRWFFNFSHWVYMSKDHTFFIYVLNRSVTAPKILFRESLRNLNLKKKLIKRGLKYIKLSTKTKSFTISFYKYSNFAFTKKKKKRFQISNCYMIIHYEYLIFITNVGSYITILFY